MLYVLEIPFEFRSLASSAGAKWNKSRGAWVFEGESLPNSLKPYLPKPYSWTDYQMHTGRGALAPAKGTGNVTLRADQAENVADLRSAFEHGAPEVLIASKTGTGKTYVGLRLAMSLPQSGKVLIVCPKSAIANWRRAIADFGPQGKRFCIINYESLKKLLKPPAASSSKTAKTKRGKRNANRRQNVAHASKGTPRVKWDVVILDEAHYLANPTSQRTLAKESIVNGSPGVRIINVSATIGRDPTKLGSLARGFSWRTGTGKATTVASTEEWYEWCKRKNMQVEIKYWGKEGTLKWEYNERDLNLINHLLFNGDVKWAVRADPGWDSIQRYQVPLELDAAEMEAYEQSWDEFKQTMKTLERAKARAQASGKSVGAASQAKGLAALIRYRQKVGQLKAPYIAEYVHDVIEGGGTQVAISCEFMGTVGLIRDSLEKKGVKVALYTGENSDSREEEREAFQRGDKPVIIFTPSESFNLHQGEPGGNDLPRVQVCAEPSWSAIKGVQKEGRTNRNGMSAPVIYPEAEGTIDCKILPTLLQGYQAIELMMGDEKTVTKNLSGLVGTDVSDLVTVDKETT